MFSKVKAPVKPLFISEELFLCLTLFFSAWYIKIKDAGYKIHDTGVGRQEATDF
jgi:hypothetical protein